MACPTFTVSAARWGAPATLTTRVPLGFGIAPGRVGLQSTVPGSAEISLQAIWTAIEITVQLPPPPDGCSSPFEILVYIPSEPEACRAAITIDRELVQGALPPRVVLSLERPYLECQGELVLQSQPGSGFGSGRPDDVALVDPLATGMRTAVSRLENWGNEAITSRSLPTVAEIQRNVPANSLWYPLNVSVTPACRAMLPAAGPIPVVIPPPRVESVSIEPTTTCTGEVVSSIVIRGDHFGVRDRLRNSVYWVGNPALTVPSFATVDPAVTPQTLPDLDQTRVRRDVKSGINLVDRLLDVMTSEGCRGAWSDNEIRLAVPPSDAAAAELLRLGRTDPAGAGVVVVTRDDIPSLPLPLSLPLPEIPPTPPTGLPLMRVRVSLGDFCQGPWTQNVEGHSNFIAVSVGAELVDPDDRLPRLGNARPPAPTVAGLSPSIGVAVLAPGEEVPMVPVWVSRGFSVNFLPSHRNPIGELNTGRMGESSFTLVVPASPGVVLRLQAVAIRYGNLADPRACQVFTALSAPDATTPPRGSEGSWQFQFGTRTALYAKERFGIPPRMASATWKLVSIHNNTLDFTVTVEDVLERPEVGMTTDVIALNPNPVAAGLGLPVEILDPRSYFSNPDAAAEWGSVEAIRGSFGLPGG